MAVMISVAVGTLLWPMDTHRYIEVEASGEILDRSGLPLMVFLNGSEQWCFPRRLNEVSPYLVKATIAAEDQRFLSHLGVDPAAVIRAACQNALERRIVSGASTLTMQVVKSGSVSSRSLAGKVVQAIQAIRLDARAGKDEILEFYLNSAPYGQNLVGCEAASRRYFGVPASELTVAEAALLAGLPKSPTGFMPLAHPEEARVRRDYVLRRMVEEGFISTSDFDRAASTAVEAVWNEFPKHSPHFAMRLESSNRNRSPVTTTLELRTQAEAEAIVNQHLRSYPDEITNAAMIVVDIETAEVLARVGSGDFFDTPGGGQVDACRALRSPGSTLKPFIYGWAIEANRLYPRETLYDGTLDYGRYSPVNFDGTYNGLVSAADALRYSLNIPVITVLDRIGVAEFCTFLPEIGIDSVSKAPDSYGLGLAIGNCEVRLEDVASAYCTIANLGEYRPLRYVVSGNVSSPQRRLSRGTCLSLYAMLEQPLPTEFDVDLVPTGRLATRVCWKTGTSAGNRDAWAFVFNQHYLVGVWMGNNDGSNSKRLVGADVALPLAAEFFRTLPPKARPAWPEDKEAIKSVRTCSLSGLPVTAWCEHTRLATMPRGQYVLRTCDVHYPTADGDATEARIVERWPGSAIKWDLASVDGDDAISDTYNHGSRERRDELRILSPSNHAVFVLSGETNGDRIALQASTERRTALHWYMDRHYLGVSQPGSPILLKLDAGTHRLTCMDPGGAFDSVVFEATLPENTPFPGS
jgi:penicillin-binding protein 1C